jgi:hypothetical protein
MYGLKVKGTNDVRTQRAYEKFMAFQGDRKKTSQQ